MGGIIEAIESAASGAFIGILFFMLVAAAVVFSKILWRLYK